MGGTIPPTPPSGEPGRLTRDPVRVAWVIALVLNGVNSALLIAEKIDAVTGGLVSAVIAVVFTGVSELFVRPATVPRAPLAQLAEQQDK